MILITIYLRSESHDIYAESGAIIRTNLSILYGLNELEIAPGFKYNDYSIILNGESKNSNGIFTLARPFTFLKV